MMIRLTYIAGSLFFVNFLYRNLISFKIRSIMLCFVVLISKPWHVHDDYLLTYIV